VAFVLASLVGQLLLGALRVRMVGGRVRVPLPQASELSKGAQRGGRQDYDCGQQREVADARSGQRSGISVAELANARTLQPARLRRPGARASSSRISSVWAPNPREAGAFSDRRSCCRAQHRGSELNGGSTPSCRPLLARANMVTHR